MSEEQMKYIANLISQDLEKDKEVERLNNIINEVREFIYKCNDGKQGINYSGCSKLLEILDKGSK